MFLWSFTGWKTKTTQFLPVFLVSLNEEMNSGFPVVASNMGKQSKRATYDVFFCLGRRTLVNGAQGSSETGCYSQEMAD